MNTNNVWYINVAQRGLTHASDGKSSKGYTLNVRVSVSLSQCMDVESKCEKPTFRICKIKWSHTDFQIQAHHFQG